MILSHKYRFIFIKTKKVAGTSFEIALSKFLGPKDVITPIGPRNEALRRALSKNGPRHFRMPLSQFRPDQAFELLQNARFYLTPGRQVQWVWPTKFYNHIPAHLIQKRVGGNIWESYHKLTIERNPWDKVVSMYYIDNRNKEEQFRDYVLNGNGYHASDYDLYCIRGVPAMDTIMRFETLEQDIRRFSDQVGLPETLLDLMRDIRANAQYRSVTPYRELYDDETRNMVARQFAREIATFGYQF